MLLDQAPAISRGSEGSASGASEDQVEIRSGV